ncbi:hypothetical protein [uncultured Aureimonas sp.]|uniref:hypothetical protein n=1 Tax=uncultured Aureimonas sp. TaxID=1604662 RepID=UPI0025CC1CE1|nr:hypothetical protein [uncultured Aureimonas sp.]
MVLSLSSSALVLGLPGVASDPGGGGVVVPPTLQPLTLSASSFSQSLGSGSDVATIGGKSAGTTVELIGGNGRLAGKSDGSKLVKGLLGCTPNEAIAITLREIDPVSGAKRDTALSLTATALAAIANPAAASQAPVAVYGLRRIVPGYAGNALQVRNSANAAVTIGFNADDTLNTSALAASGDGVTFRVSTLYDQSGNARDVATANRPRLVFPNAPTSYDGAYIDFDTTNANLATSLTFLDVGGTANLSVFMVLARYGYGASYGANRPGAPTTTGKTVALSYGTTAGSILLGGAPSTIARSSA